jgi:hypothetical protein
LDVRSTQRAEKTATSCGAGNPAGDSWLGTSAGRIAGATQNANDGVISVSRGFDQVAESLNHVARSLH